MARRDNNVDGPIILWLDYGAYEGWRPVSYDSVKEALEDERYGNKFSLTRPIRYEIKEAEET